MRLLLVCAMALVLTACAGSANIWGHNPQSYSGVNYVTFEYPTEAGAITGTLYGGKEQDTVSITVLHPSGVEVTYSASGAKAFEGQEIRAAVEKAVSQDAKEAMPGIVDTITKAITSAVGQ